MSKSICLSEVFCQTVTMPANQDQQNPAVAVLLESCQLCSGREETLSEHVLMTRNRYFMMLAAVGLVPFMTWSIAASDGAAPATSMEAASRTVEDGGTGPYKALMVSDKTLPTHTVFRPKDLGAFGAALNCRSSRGGTGHAPILRGSM